MGYDNLSKAKVMVLGTFHFQGSLDVIQNQSGDLMSEEKQIEIAHVVSKLTDFKPTKIAVEIDKIDHDKLNQSFQDYLNNSFDLSINEVHQLGFKIGKELKLDSISAIDWMESIGNRSIQEVLDWAHNNQLDLYNKIMDEYILKLDMDFQGLNVLESYNI